MFDYRIGFLFDFVRCAKQQRHLFRTVTKGDCFAICTIRASIISMYLVKPGHELCSELCGVAQNGVLSESKSLSNRSNVRIIDSSHGGMEIIQHRPVDNNNENDTFNFGFYWTSLSPRLPRPAQPLFGSAPNASFH